MGRSIEIGGPLSDAEVVELDGYGPLTGVEILFGPLPARAVELWGREILFGRANDDRGFGVFGDGGNRQ